MIDIAQQLDERLRRAEIASVRARTEGEGTEACEACGAEIEPARRRAAPWATRCLACQSIAERRQRGL
ncbi:TraR/DksA C4-type zinc finger protein [Xanthobacter sp. DSM 24535]|uniref:TraR/DksA C4-type zinc finger protein n=1 Tax=Roseixanthobacter psychrophilus TaxID=3119917 RepID=UPI003727E5B3